MIARSNLPIRAISGNVIYARGALAGVYRVETASYAFLSGVEKERWHQRLAWWMLKVETDFSVYRVCREYPADAYVQDTVSLIDERHGDRARWEDMLTRHSERLRDLHSYVPEVYVVVSLRANSKIPWKRPGQDSKLVRDSDQAALEALQTYLPSRRATTLELQWLLRRAAVRGVCEPDVDPHWVAPALAIEGGVWEPTRADVQRFMAEITERGRSLSVAGEDGESVQSVLALGPMPKTSEFPGEAELLYAPLEGLDFPVDVVAHVHWETNKKMQSRCDNAVKDAHNAIEDATARLLDWKTQRRGDESAAAQDYFATEPYPPGLYVSASLAVGAEDGEQLDERVKRLRHAYGSVRLYQAHALQSSLYGDHLLRPDGAQVRDYEALFTREQLAATMPIGSHAAGSDQGIYIGHTIPGAARPVRYNPLEASQRNRAGAVIMCGALGGGKTMAGQLLAYHAARRGSIVVDVDPRPDHSLERLLNNVHVISLDDVDSNRGLLDPLVVAPEALREELTASYLMDLLPQALPEWQTEIISAVRAVMREPNPSSARVVKHMLDSEDPHAYACGRALAVWSDWGLCKLAFGDNERGAQTDVKRLVTTIKVAGLSLPPAGSPRTSYDQSERVSVATLKLIVAYAMRLVSGDRSTHKLLMLDEAHTLADTADGRRFLSRLIRMSRSMNVTLLLLTQLLGDLAELGELIGVRFCFRQETDEQARLNLRMFGLDENNERLVAMLRDFSDGRCLMSGLDGRVAAMKFDVEPGFLEIADTNPTRIDLAALERQVAT